MAFYQLEPFGQERADLRSAIIACTMANAWRGEKQRAFTISDFMPKFGEREGQTEEEMIAVAKMISGYKDGND